MRHTYVVDFLPKAGVFWAIWKSHCMVSLHQQLYPKPTAACHDFSLLLQAPPHGRLKIHPTVGGLGCWPCGISETIKVRRSGEKASILHPDSCWTFSVPSGDGKSVRAFGVQNTADTLSLQHKCPRHSGEFAQLANQFGGTGWVKGLGPGGLGFESRHP